MKKKFMFMVLAVVGLFSFTQAIDVESMFYDVTQMVNEAPSGTTYGVIESTDKSILINTPVGKYSIDKDENGEYSFLGLKAKIKSRKGNTYVIESSIGDFKIDVNKCNVTKIKESNN